MSSQAVQDLSIPHTNGDAHGASHGHDGHDAHVHITPPALLLGVYGVLVFLTIATVGVTLIEMGPLKIWVALAIAVVKAGVVALYFMHLRWDSPFNGAVLLISLFFVALFIGISMLDSSEYDHNFTPPGVNINH